MKSFVADFTFNISDAIIDHNGVLLQSHFFLLKLSCLLLQECYFVQIILLELAEVLFKVIHVFEDFFKDIVEALSALMLKSSAFRSQKLGVFFIIIKCFYSFFDVELKNRKTKLDKVDRNDKKGTANVFVKSQLYIVYSSSNERLLLP